MPTKLPERYRKARNLDEGFEIQIEDGSWAAVVGALHMTAPIEMSSFTVKHEDGTEARLNFHPDRDEVMSRRPAGVDHG